MSQIRAIQLRRGTRAELDAYGPLLIGELGFCTDTGELFIGTPTGNKLINPDIEIPDTIPWANVTGKPSTFPPSSHSHSWGEITGKPSTFTPSSHTHSASDLPSASTSAKGVVQLTTSTSSTSTTLAATASAVKAAYDLANKKADANHSHSWSQITGKPSTFPPSSHTHSDYLALRPVSAGTNVILASPASFRQSQLNESMTKTISVRIMLPITGTLRISWVVFSYSSEGIIFSRVYRNGSPVGTEVSHEVDGSDRMTYTQDIGGWTFGDELAIYARGDHRFTVVGIEDLRISVA